MRFSVKFKRILLVDSRLLQAAAFLGLFSFGRLSAQTYHCGVGFELR